jgi:hypothetical protein
MGDTQESSTSSSERGLTYDFQDGNGPVPAKRHTNPDGSTGGWVALSTRVYGNALVYSDAQVYGNAWVYGNARVYGNAQVYGNARVSWGLFLSLNWTAWVNKSETVDLSIGYQLHTIEEWEKDGEKIAAKNDMLDKLPALKALCVFVREVVKP